jgi:periplasmic divalent cation tolerance protein
LPTIRRRFDPSGTVDPWVGKPEAGDDPYITGETEMEFVLAYMTAGSEEEARTVARTLVEERLAACVNILGPATSIYHWEGAIEEAREVILIAKTRRALFDRLTERVRAIHGYEVPCVLELAIGRGNPAYLTWLADETAATATGP